VDQLHVLCLEVTDQCLSLKWKFIPDEVPCRTCSLFCVNFKSISLDLVRNWFVLWTFSWNVGKDLLLSHSREVLVLWQFIYPSMKLWSFAVTEPCSFPFLLVFKCTTVSTLVCCIISFFFPYLIGYFSIMIVTNLNSCSSILRNDLVRMLHAYVIDRSKTSKDKIWFDFLHMPLLFFKNLVWCKSYNVCSYLVVADQLIEGDLFLCYTFWSMCMHLPRVQICNRSTITTTYYGLWLWQND